MHEVIDLIVSQMKIQGCHSLSELSCRQNTIAISIKECECFSHIETLQVECGSNPIQNLMQSSLPKSHSLEGAAELSDVDFSNACWIGNSSQQAMILNRQWKVELFYSGFEFFYSDYTSFCIQWVIQALEAIVEGNIPFLKEGYNSIFQVLHCLSLRTTKMLLVLFPLLICFKLGTFSERRKFLVCLIL